MSGICGILNLDGAPVTRSEMESITRPLERRGPEGSATWVNGSVGFGHTLLATTPEMLREKLPWQDRASGCSITADVRLDNRRELIRALDLESQDLEIGDAQVVLAAYLRWGAACAERFIGDFAIALWDPRDRSLLLLRDHFGLRPIYYHHAPGRRLVFASEAEAILQHPKVPRILNEIRIADFLVGYEDADLINTFFRGVVRLPPAHSLSISGASEPRFQRYWRLEPGPTVSFASDAEYLEGFRELFVEAVRCRLRGPPAQVGCMLSGGMDSGSVVGVARQLRRCAGLPALDVFSAMADMTRGCRESETIEIMQSLEGLRSHVIRPGQLTTKFDDFIDRWLRPEEPFDGHMPLILAIYRLAAQSGMKVLLDGVGGDVMLSGGLYLARLIRAFRLPEACRESCGEASFYGQAGCGPVAHLVTAVRQAWTPKWARLMLARERIRRIRRSTVRAIRESALSEDFARRTGAVERWVGNNPGLPPDRVSDPTGDRLLSIHHPCLIVARERYDRVAASLGLEARDPFCDIRLARFTCRLPDRWVVRNGIHKWILREAMAGYVPNLVRWRKGKDHLGLAFNLDLHRRHRETLKADLLKGLPQLATVLDRDKSLRITADSERPIGSSVQIRFLELAMLNLWRSRVETDLAPKGSSLPRD